LAQAWNGNLKEDVGQIEPRLGRPSERLKCPETGGSADTGMGVFYSIVLIRW
jgi:hypothetical protein